MHKTSSLLERIYEKNPENGNYVIEVSLDTYTDIFNDWDHAPMKRKDIDPELLHFLEDSIDDIPMKYSIDLCLYLTQEVRNTEREQVIISWFKTFYRFYIELEKKKIRSLLKNAVIYLFISGILLTSSYLGIGTRNNIVVYTLTEIVIVGGWVFLWEAISLFTFERAKISKRIRNYRRFVDAEITFRYK